MKKSIRDAVEVESLDVPGTGTVMKGLRVRHPVFGLGTVAKVVRFGCNAGYSIVVLFDGDARYKPLCPEYAKLELVKG